MTETWDRLVIDRTDDLLRRAPVFQGLLQRKLDVLAHFNNDCTGHASALVRMLQEMPAKVGVG